MQERLSNDFIAELVKYCLSNKKVLEVCKKHLKFHYLVTEAQKKVVDDNYRELYRILEEELDE